MRTEDAGLPRASFAHGACDRPLLYLTVGEALDRAAGAWPDREALVVRHQDVRQTYAQLKEEVDRVAAGLVALGLKPGDRVGIWSPNNVEWVITQFATARVGLILVNVNPALRVDELEHVLNKVECRALILADKFKTSDYLAMLRDLAPELDDCEPGHLQSHRLPTLQIVVLIGDTNPPGCYRFSELATRADEAAQDKTRKIAASLQPDDPINIQFTSGTTGLPKGATLTHFNILNNAFFVADCMKFTERDRLCVPLPLYHCFGMVLGVLGCVTHGAAAIFPDEAFEPGCVLETVASERCTALYGVPTMFIAELEHPEFEEYDLSSLRTGIMAGAPCPVEVMQRVMNDMHMTEVTICYGMTETSPVSTQTAVTDPVDKRVATVGHVHPHVQIKITDEKERIVPRGTSGEICTRGYSVMRGYWGDPEQTRECIDAAGWMHTGDLGVMDNDGYISIVGRLKDMIIRGGENIYPREIEEFLIRHPKIRDVAVFGIPDARYGEEVAAWIQLKDGEQMGEDEVREFCRERIAHFKVPRVLRFVGEFPMTVTGKQQKFVMQQRMKKELGL